MRTASSFLIRHRAPYLAFAVRAKREQSAERALLRAWHTRCGVPGGGEACHPAGKCTPAPCLGTHLHRVMSISRLVSITGENVIEAAGAHGSAQVCLQVTFQGVGARCQTAPLKQSTGAVVCRRAAKAGPLTCRVLVSSSALGVCPQDCARRQPALVR